MTDITHCEGRFKGSLNLDLFYQSWMPQDPKGALVIVHGIGDHSSRYSHVGTYFSKHGYAVYAYDQRGNGRSSGRKGHIRNFDEYMLDLACFIKNLNLSRKPFLLGHSLGGLVAIRYAMDYPEDIAGIIVSSPALGLSMKVPIWKKAVAYSLHTLYPEFTFIDNEISSEYLTHDTAVCKAYDEDPLVHRMRSASFFVEFVKAYRRTLREPRKLKIPSLFLQAGDDRIVSVGALKEFYEGIVIKDKAIKIYPNFYHEILNEIEKNKVFKDIERWLNSLSGA